MHCLPHLVLVKHSPLPCIVVIVYTTIFRSHKAEITHIQCFISPNPSYIPYA